MGSGAVAAGLFGCSMTGFELHPLKVSAAMESISGIDLFTWPPPGLKIDNHYHVWLQDSTEIVVLLPCSLSLALAVVSPLGLPRSGRLPASERSGQACLVRAACKLTVVMVLYLLQPGGMLAGTGSPADFHAQGGIP